MTDPDLPAGTADAAVPVEDRLVVLLSRNARMTPGKAAAQAVHAALIAYGVRHGAVVVLDATDTRIREDCDVVVRDAGRTEVAPHTLTAGVRRDSVGPPRLRPAPTGLPAGSDEWVAQDCGCGHGPGRTRHHHGVGSCVDCPCRAHTAGFGGRALPPTAPVTRPVAVVAP